MAPAAEAVDHQTSEKPEDSRALATVNGETLSLAMFDFLLGNRSQQEQESAEFTFSEPELSNMRAQAAEDLVLTEVLAQEALRLKVDQQRNNKIEIALAQKTLLAQLMVREIMDNISVNDADIRAVYDAEESTSLFRFNIWMTPSEAEARQLLSYLKNKDAKQANKQTYEKIETPWLDQNELDPAVVDIVEAAAIGDFVPNPIAQDGLWKVVQVIDKNRFDKPPYEDAMEIIRADLVQAQVDAEIKRLSEKADIQVITKPL